MYIFGYFSRILARRKQRARAAFPSRPQISILMFGSAFSNHRSPLHTIKSRTYQLHAIREGRFGGVPPSLRRFFIGFGRSERKMCKKTQNFQISSKFHRLNRRKDGIFSCMRSARVDWGKSHRQIVKFSRGLRFRAKICIFSTRNHAKIILFDFFRSFRVMAPAATPQKYKNNTKYASDRGPFTARHNYAFPRTIPLCL